MSDIFNVVAIYETPKGINHLDVPIDLSYFHPSWCDEEILDNIYPQVFEKMNETIEGKREFLKLKISNDDLIEKVHDYFR